MGLLDNKVILVTGGTSGIGQASAELFAKEGAKVLLSDRASYVSGQSIVVDGGQSAT